MGFVVLAAAVGVAEEEPVGWPNQTSLVSTNMKTSVLRVLVSIALTLGTIGGGVFAQGSTPVGLWETIDDESHEPESYVRIWVDNGELFGKVEKLIRKPGESSDPRCTKCAGDKKDQPILGMTILSGLRQEGAVWIGGHILDPDNGTVYKCRIKLEDGGSKLGKV